MQICKLDSLGSVYLESYSFSHEDALEDFGQVSEVKGIM